MASPQKIRANRANARRSTGPRTKDGRLRARLNALKHGLAVPASAHSALQRDIDHLARALAGEAQHDSVVMVRAQKVAEAAIEVQRARRARLELLRGWDWSTDKPEAGDLAELVRDFEAVRKEFQDLAHKESSKEKGRELRLPQSVAKRLGGVAKTFKALNKAHPDVTRMTWDDLLRQLERLERYERRARSRRDRAIKEFDYMKTKAMSV